MTPTVDTGSVLGRPHASRARRLLDAAHRDVSKKKTTSAQTRPPNPRTAHIDAAIQFVDQGMAQHAALGRWSLHSGLRLRRPSLTRPLRGRVRPRFTSGLRPP